MMTIIDTAQFNQPPFLPQWLCEGETLSLAKIGDAGIIELDTAIIAVADLYNIETAAGVQLDRIGKILKLVRNGKSDDIYRVLLLLKAFLNRTNGTVENIITLVQFLYGATVITVSPNYPAGLTIVHNGRSTLDAFSLAVFSNGNQIGFSDGNFMVFSSPDYSLDTLVSAAIPAGVSYTITKV
jgi:hypothetical protein